ncbi:MAG: VOC family protein [Chloroflexi bacterium]|jgi:glyoxylase I family protein|nr:MAG: VOC family protein [Chloroflexota bacterium]
MSAIEIRGLDHVVLRISDLSRSLRFYVELLGCREERRSDALGLVQLRAGANLIDLVDVNSPLGKLGGPPAGAQARNVDHIALQLEHFDADAIRARLTEFGVEAGEVAQRYGALGMGPSIYVRDPDGNVVELKGPPGPGT